MDKRVMLQIDHKTILIVEDDIKLACLIKDYLVDHGFEVHHAENGEEGLKLARSINPDLVILDLMMPLMDGLSVCRHMQNWFNGRIVVLTASDEDMDQVAALEMGAHDYVKKPIHPRVLLARIRALLRRDEIRPDQIASTQSAASLEQNNSQTRNDEYISYGQLSLHKGRRQTQLNGNFIPLTEAEFELLWFIANNPEQPLSRDQIMKELRGIEHDGLDRAIDNRIVALRKKLDDIKGLPRRIITVRGKGYMFVTDQW